jgi:hypothetical protein
LFDYTPTQNKIEYLSAFRVLLSLGISQAEPSVG